MKARVIIFTLFLLGISGCKTQKNSFLYDSASLKVERLAENSYRHVSYLQTQDYGNVACNGMIVVDDGEALIFDSPSGIEDAEELIDWVENTLKSKVVGIIVNHFHSDCLGGLKAFHDRGIPSYSNNKTRELAESNNEETPQRGFEKYQEIAVGNKKVLNEFLGEGHTVDNIVSYFPEDKVLFGGCMIKSISAGKGNLADANTNEWSNTVRAVKSKYGEAQVVIPGHGSTGNVSLLDYTIQMFEQQ